jgi:hypothetical protein
MSAVKTVAVLGSSPNPDRYSNMAARCLHEAGQHKRAGHEINNAVDTRGLSIARATRRPQ